MREGPDDLGSFETVAALPSAGAAADCDGAIRLEDRGNQDYRWWYLINTAGEDATLSIRRSWMFAGAIRTDTRQHRLYPGEEREVFSFPRNQDPRVTFLHCRLESKS
jgi:hypothetical protein